MSTKNLKVTITIGLPASGKSTWSKDQIRKNSNTIRVNRDDFRFMLKDSQVCENKIEGFITELCDDLIMRSLSKKLNVIVDNTHLKAKYINQIIHLVSDFADVDYMLFDVPLATCLERDNNREKKVGEAVLKRMNKDFLILKDSFHFQPIIKNRVRKQLVPNFSSELPSAVCFDIDGTLALMGNRSPYDWHKVDLDSPNQIVIEQVKFHKSLGREIIVLSGRDGSCRELTIEWLKFYGVEFDQFFMRETNDMRKDSIIKKEIYNTHIKPNYNLLCVFDDRLQVVNMWYNEGVFCYNVNQGNQIF